MFGKCKKAINGVHHWIKIWDSKEQEHRMRCSYCGLYLDEIELPTPKEAE